MVKTEFETIKKEFKINLQDLKSICKCNCCKNYKLPTKESNIKFYEFEIDTKLFSTEENIVKICSQCISNFISIISK